MMKMEHLEPASRIVANLREIRVLRERLRREVVYLRGDPKRDVTIEFSFEGQVLDTEAIEALIACMDRHEARSIRALEAYGVEAAPAPETDR